MLNSVCFKIFEALIVEVKTGLSIRWLLSETKNWPTG